MVTGQITLLTGPGGFGAVRDDVVTVWDSSVCSPFDGLPSRPYEGAAWVPSGGSSDIPGHRYNAHLVTGKAGPVGAIQLVALIGRPATMTRNEAWRHWDEHIPLAIVVHYKALSYRQFRFDAPGTASAPDYTGMAVLSFANADDLRTGLYRNAGDLALIEADVREFVGDTAVMYCTERTCQRL